MTNPAHMKKWRQRMKRAGFIYVQFHLHKEDAALMRAYAAQLTTLRKSTK